MALPGVPFDHMRVFDSDIIARLSFLPQSVAILGSGIVAIEFANIFAALGCSVTMLVRNTVLSSLARIGRDADIAERLVAALRAQRVVIMEGTSVGTYGRDEDGVAREREGPPLRLTLVTSSGGDKEESTLSCDIFMAAAGRTPVS